LALADDRCESAMNAMASAPANTTLRVDLCITWPGTVKSLILIANPAAVPNWMGRKSKYSVRSSAVSSVTILPRESGLIHWWSCWRLVVLPESAGP
jgi:hypothetical protein